MYSILDLKEAQLLFWFHYELKHHKSIPGFLCSVSTYIMLKSLGYFDSLIWDYYSYPYSVSTSKVFQLCFTVIYVTA